jgi:8-oxo-dGTP pyrophosphatase MutT (NUDIX family)
VLLRWHTRHDTWMQVGGHGDPGESAPYAVALREAVEETGLEDLVSFPDAAAPRLIQVAVVAVRATAKEPAHLHGDLRYVMATSSPDAIVPESEDNPLRWCTFAEAESLVGEDNLRDFATANRGAPSPTPVAKRHEEQSLLRGISSRRCCLVALRTRLVWSLRSLLALVGLVEMRWRSSTSAGGEPLAYSPKGQIAVAQLRALVGRDDA